MLLFNSQFNLSYLSFFFPPSNDTRMGKETHSHSFPHVPFISNHTVQLTEVLPRRISDCRFFSESSKPPNYFLVSLLKPHPTAVDWLLPFAVVCSTLLVFLQKRDWGELLPGPFSSLCKWKCWQSCQCRGEDKPLSSSHLPLWNASVLYPLLGCRNGLPAPPPYCTMSSAILFFLVWTCHLSSLWSTECKWS